MSSRNRRASNSRRMCSKRCGNGGGGDQTLILGICRRLAGVFGIRFHDQSQLPRPDQAQRRPERRHPAPLIREDAEASLCGIARASLGAAGGFDELVCPDCMEWLPKRMDFSDAHPKVAKT